MCLNLNIKFWAKCLHNFFFTAQTRFWKFCVAKVNFKGNFKLSQLISICIIIFFVSDFFFWRISISTHRVNIYIEMCLELCIKSEYLRMWSSLTEQNYLLKRSFITEFWILWRSVTSYLKVPLKKLIRKTFNAAQTTAMLLNENSFFFLFPNRLKFFYIQFFFIRQNKFWFSFSLPRLNFIAYQMLTHNIFRKLGSFWLFLFLCNLQKLNTM